MKRFLIIILLLQPVIAQTKTAPDWKLKDLSGRQIRLRKYKGKVVLLNFWATWCAPCLAEIPELVKWQRKYPNLQIIGITYPPQTRGEIRRSVRKLKINYPIIQGTTALKAYFTTSDTLPWTVVIDGASRIHANIEGILYEDEFAKKILPLLQPNKSPRRVRTK